MVKNLNEKDVALCLYALEDPEREKHKQDVLLRDRVMTRADINTYLKKTKRTEESLRAAVAYPTAWPSQITFRSSQPQLETSPSSDGHYGAGQGFSPSQLPELPTPSWTSTPSWNVSSRSSKILTPRSSLSQRTSFSSMQVVYPDAAKMAEEDSVMVDHLHHAPPDTERLTGDFDMCEDDDVSEGDMANICAGVAQSDNFGAMVRQAADPKPLSGDAISDPLFFRLLSRSTPAFLQYDQQSLTAVEVPKGEPRFVDALNRDRESFVWTGPAHRTTLRGQECAISVEPSVSFLRECLGACIVRGQGFCETANDLMHGAVQVFRSMIVRSDPYCLTALNLLLAVFESVGQRPMVEKVLRDILKTSDELEREGPINVTIRFMLEIVGGQARQSQYNVHRLWKVYYELCDLCGIDSPSALAGLYHVAWSLALDKDTRREAWTILKDLNVKCELTLGRGHFQTITSMTTSARVLYHLGEQWQAALMINQAIQRLDLMYEDFHPYRLEARARQAKLLMKLGGSHDVESILQDVVRQQAEILGVHNTRTQSTLATLQDFLKNKGRSQEAYSLPEILERISNSGSLDQ